jgi:hypothetical protein
MDLDFVVECDDKADRPALTGWETVVFELEDDPDYLFSVSSTAAIAP